MRLREIFRKANMQTNCGVNLLKQKLLQTLIGAYRSNGANIPSC